MDITETVHCKSRQEWREWLQANHDQKTEIWLLSSNTKEVSYLESVEEALCFGWIDGIHKRRDAHTTAQRFTPRRKNSHWTELNKERVRRLIAEGLMTEAGTKTLPDLDVSKFSIAPDIVATLQADEQVWANFQQFPDVYQRIRIGYIEEMRKQPKEFATRLENFISKTRANKLFGTLR
jgi:uncharacterized protein YdeI (YjbR/CyaY-like superfamily)